MPGLDCSRGGLQARLATRLEELEARIAAEQARPDPDPALLRRLRRERVLQRDRVAAAAGSGMPAWAREALPNPA